MTSRGRWQYQISSEPIAPIANPTQTDSFFQPFSDPIQLSIKTISVALIASQVVSMVPPTSGGNAWHSTAVTVPQHSDSLPSSTVSFQYQATTQAPPAATFTPVSIGWFEPLSEPVRTKPIDVWFQDWTKGTQPVVSFSYYEPLSEPQRQPPRDVWFQPDTLTRTQTDVTGIKYLPLSEPVRSPLRDAWYQADALVQIVQQDTLGSWYEPLSEPVRTAARAAWYQDAASLNPYPIPNAQVLPPLTWFAPLADPVRIPIRTAWYQDLTLDPIPIPNSTAIPMAVQGSDPYFSLSQIQYQGLAFVQLTTTTLNTLQSWEPWSEPVRTPLRDAWYQPVTFTAIVQQDTLGSWFEPLSEPVKVPLRVAWNQYESFAVGATVPTTLTTLQSWEPWSEPVRLLPNISIYPPWAYVDTVDIVVDTGKVWPRYWMQYDPNHSINRDAPHDLVWADEDDIITVLLLS